MSSPSELRTYQHYIDGAYVTPASKSYLPTENPFTGQAWAMIARGDSDDVAAAVDAADRAVETGASPHA